MSDNQGRDNGDPKALNPNAWGLAACAIAFVVLPITHYTIGFPDMLVHVFMFPILIGLMVRWWIKLNYTNPYRDD